MSLQEVFSLQIQAFQTAILDNLDRAVAPGQTDAMALRLRDSALALVRLQVVMLARCQATAAEAMPPRPEPQVTLLPPGQDHLLSGDTLSHFISRRLEPDESPHDVWQVLQAAEPKRRAAKRPRKPGLPKAGFRSSAG